MHYKLLAASPDYALNRKQIQQSIPALARTVAAEEREIVTIPVVVHVIWKLPEENILEDQINSQIDALNRDFRKRNSDAEQVPEIWKPLAADTRIEFKLAATDPGGNPTTGITRTKSDRNTFLTGTNDVKFSSRGGADAWPTERYLNLWVCRQIDEGFLAYAQFPGGPAETDGIVTINSAFGTTGTVRSPFNLGRTVTHELGYWLNLNNIWGDDSDACSGSDNVDDTPNQGGQNFGIPVYPHISCNNAPHGDMFMNYMDFVDDISMYMFTKGQAARMHDCLSTVRASLLGQTFPA
jgi:hypothetical protein